MFNIWTHFRNKTTREKAVNNRGQGLVEYALILIFVGIAVVAIVNVMQPAIADVFSRIVNKNVVAPPALAGYTPPPTNTPTATIDPLATPTETPTTNPLATSTDTPSPTATATATATDTATATATATDVPCAYGPHTVPGHVEMEDFMCGGAGAAFSDLTSDGGPGSASYRTDVAGEGPDLQTTSDTGGGYNLGWTRDNEWVRYEIIVSETRQYDFSVRVASPNSDARLRISANGVNRVQIMPNTGGWQTWTDVTISGVPLLAGTNTVEFYFEKGGANFNYFNVTLFVPTSTPTNTPTSTPTSTPAPGALIYLSSSSGGTAGGVDFADEDVLIHNDGTGSWNMYLDMGDTTVTDNLQAFTLLDNGSVLMSFTNAVNIPGVGTVDNTDIVRFIPATTGDSTSGSYELYFDGSDVGLSVGDENIDALAVLGDGRILISTVGNVNTGSVSGKDEDLFAFTPTQLGSNTSGSWEMYFDGSDVGLSSSSDEDVNGVWVDNTTGDIYLTTVGSFSVSGVSGDQTDIFVCTPSSLGSSTSCTYSLYWDGSANGYGNEQIDGLFIDLP